MAAERTVAIGHCPETDPNTPLPPPPNPVRLIPLSDANGGAADDDFAFGYGSRPLAG